MHTIRSKIHEKWTFIYNNFFIWGYIVGMSLIYAGNAANRYQFVSIIDYVVPISFNLNETMDGWWGCQAIHPFYFSLLTFNAIVMEWKIKFTLLTSTKTHESCSLSVCLCVCICRSVLLFIELSVYLCLSIYTWKYNTWRCCIYLY